MVSLPRLSLRALILALVVGVLFAGLSWVQFNRVNAQSTGTVTGTVSAAPGTDIENFTVSLCQITGKECMGVRVETFEDLGTYTLDYAPVGDYKLQFSPGWPPPNGFAVEYYDDIGDMSSALTVTIEAGQTLSNMDAELGQEAVVRGIITGLDDEVMDEGVTLFACRNVGGECSSIGIPATVLYGGTYELRGLPPGTIYIWIQVNQSLYLSEYYGETDDLEMATPITLTEGEIRTGIDIQLTPNESFSGRVTDNEGNPLANLSVSACSVEHVGECLSHLAGYTDNNGEYSVFGVSPGPVYVEFQDATVGDVYFPRQYWPGVPAPSVAEVITITHRSPITGINAIYLPSSSIAGTVTGSDGQGLYFARVTLCWWNGSRCHNQTFPYYTEMDGSWTGWQLFPGTYRLFIEDGDGNHEPEFYGDALTLESATDVEVPPGAPTTGINAQLGASQAPYLVRGTVSGSGGTPLSGIKVCEEWYECYAPTYTDATGAYTLTVQYPGYRAIAFHDPSGAYKNHLYPETIDFFGNHRFLIRSGVDLDNHDVELAPGGIIAGEIKDMAGNLVDNIEVTLCQQSIWDADYCDTNIGWLDPAETGKTSYLFGGLENGNYRIYFRDVRGPELYGAQWYDGKGSELEADWVAVTVGETTTKDVHLIRYGTISGQLKDQFGAPIEPAGIALCPQAAGANHSCTDEFRAYTDAEGNYSFPVSAPGSYRVYFGTYWNNFVPGYHANGASHANATIVTVANGQDITGIDAVLQRILEPTSTPTPTQTPTATPVTLTPATTYTPIQTPTFTTTPVTPSPTATPPGGDGPDAIAEIEVLPNVATTSTVPMAGGRSIVVGVPAGAVSQATTLRFFPGDNPSPGVQTTFKLGGLVFSIAAEQNGTPVMSLEFLKPVTLRITYLDEDVDGLLSEFLELRYYDETTDSWLADGVRVVSQDPATHTIVVEIDHLTDFGLGEGSQDTFLPAVQSQWP